MGSLLTKLSSVKVSFLSLYFIRISVERSVQKLNITYSSLKILEQEKKKYWKVLEKLLRYFVNFCDYYFYINYRARDMSLITKYFAIMIDTSDIIYISMIQC